MPDETFVSVDDLCWQKIITSKILKTQSGKALSLKNQLHKLSQVIIIHVYMCHHNPPSKWKSSASVSSRGPLPRSWGVDTDINQSFKVSLQTEVGKMEPLSQSQDENQWHRIVLHSKTGYLIRTRRACPSFEARGIFLEPARRNIYICISSFPRGQCIFCVCIKGQFSARILYREVTKSLSRL